jgi:uncharacterized damage-inducible protein DinB
MINLAVAEHDAVRAPRSQRETLTRLLDELESLVVSIRTDVYGRASARRGTTIGGEVARCVARIGSLIAAAHTQTVVYGPASRDLAVDPVAALRKIRALRAGTAAWPRAPLSNVVRVLQPMSPGDDCDTGWSTLAAEAAFVIGETIEAQQSIASMLADVGLAAPERFGATPLPTLTARSSAPPSWALWQRLDQIGALLLEIPEHIYTAPVESHVSGTLGQHVRHCLDHVSALLSAEPATTLSYDRRRRGTSVESDGAAALQQILRLKSALERWSARSLDEPIRVSSTIDSSGASIAGWSTLGRELAFVLSHTIHHQATMAAVLALHGIAVPAGFGYAPSTPRPE